MDGPGAGGGGGFEYPIGPEVGVGRRALADADGLVRLLDMQGVGVGLGVDGYRA